MIFQMQFHYPVSSVFTLTNFGEGIVKFWSLHCEYGWGKKLIECFGHCWGGSGSMETLPENFWQGYFMSGYLGYHKIFFGLSYEKKVSTHWVLRNLRFENLFIKR